jgi:hypothetical protein
MGGNSNADVDDTPVRSTPAARPAPAPVAAAPAEDTPPWNDEDDTPAASAPVTTPASTATGGRRAEEILAAIKARKTS